MYDMQYDLLTILYFNFKKNKFGFGNISNDRLTELDRRLIIKAVNLEIIINLSHANKKTFNEILVY